MVRNILAGIAGYAAIFVFIFATFTVLYVVLGADGAFKEGNYEVSTTWLVVTFALAVLAALIGALVTSLISRNAKPALITLVAIILVLGSVSVVLAVVADPADAERSEDVTMKEAMENARTPLWVAVVNPFVGIGGALAVFMIRSPKASTTVTPE